MIAGYAGVTTLKVGSIGGLVVKRRLLALCLCTLVATFPLPVCAGEAPQKPASTDSALSQPKMTFAESRIRGGLDAMLESVKPLGVSHESQSQGQHARTPPPWLLLQQSHF